MILHCSPLKTLNWSQVLTMLCCPRLPPGFLWWQLLSHMGTASHQPCPLPCHPQAATCTQGLVTAAPGQTICGNLLPKLNSHRHMSAEESQKGLGKVFSVGVLLPLLIFGTDIPYTHFIRGLTICSNPFLMLRCFQGSGTCFCFLSLFNS